jgi:hypothetical protein
MLSSRATLTKPPPAQQRSPQHSSPSFPSRRPPPRWPTPSRRQVSARGSRHGRRHSARGREYYYRPITAPPPTVSARFLSEDERVRIADLRLVETGDRPQAGPRSVHDQPRYCAATPIPPPAPIGRSPRTGVPWAAVRDHDRPSWSAMSSCGQWCNSYWTGGGVPSRSATSCATASRTSRRGIWRPRTSIRRSTCKDARRVAP